MKKGGPVMKILKIDKGKGFFCATEAGKWTPIDEVNKEDLLSLVDKFVSSDVEMDEYQADTIHNQAQKIVYKSIYEKFSELAKNKDKFKDEADRMYMEQIKQYQQ